MRATILLAIFANMCALAGVSVVHASAGDATKDLKTVLGSAMEIQTRADLKGNAHDSERARLIMRLLAENFLTDEMARQSLGEYWNKLSSAQRSEFQKLFTRLFLDSYGRMVIDFLPNKSIEYGSEKQDGEGVKVDTVVMWASKHVPVTYIMVARGGRWFIRDVEIDGMSIVDNYRDSFRRVIATKSFSSLLRQMQIMSLVAAG